MNQKLPLVFFPKSFRSLNVEQLIALAHKVGFEGYDICCRAGFAVNPDNVRTALPKAVKEFARAGLVAPMVTGEGSLLEPSDSTAEPILAAMQEAGVGLLKLGYFHINSATEDYWEKVDAIRRTFAGWAKLGEGFGVKICYHTHSGPTSMGMNAAAVMHLVNGLDPRWIGVYLDPGHLLMDGEHPAIAVNMVKRYLAIVGLKDMRKEQNPVGYGYRMMLCKTGRGQVDWPAFFGALRQVAFTGPLSVHCEYNRNYPPHPSGEHPDYVPSLADEVRFYRQWRDAGKP
jgi:sugar phosphate isomerase/epimerase